MNTVYMCMYVYLGVYFLHCTTAIAIHKLREIKLAENFWDEGQKTYSVGTEISLRLASPEIK